MADKNTLFKQREKLIYELIEFNSNESNRICSLDGNWGSGKSFFIDKLIEYVKDKSDNANHSDKVELECKHEEEENKSCGFDVLKFDAWENQGNGNINAIFLESIYDELLVREYNNQPFLEYIKKYIKDWIKEAAKEIIKGVAPNIVGKTTDMITSGYEEFQELLVYETFGNQMLNQILDEKKFYDILIEILIKDRKYLIIIDELDRCEPNFAMNMIKKIIYLNKILKKSDKSVNFLISINKLEFANLLTGYYGHSYDTHQYFDKIFDYEFVLPEAKPAYEYIDMMIPRQTLPEQAFYRNKIENTINKNIKEIFEKLNYRKLNILVEKINEPRVAEFDREDLSRYFDPAYSFDRTRFTLEILKLSNYKEYLEIKTAIIRLRRQQLYNINFSRGRITLYREMANYDNSIIDIKLIGKYFTNVDIDECEVLGAELFEELNFGESETKEFKELFSYAFLVLLSNQFQM